MFAEELHGNEVPCGDPDEPITEISAADFISSFTADLSRPPADVSSQPSFSHPHFSNLPLDHNVPDMASFMSSSIPSLDSSAPPIDISSLLIDPAALRFDPSALPEEYSVQPSDPSSFLSENCVSQSFSDEPLISFGEGRGETVTSELLSSESAEIKDEAALQ